MDSKVQLNLRVKGRASGAYAPEGRGNEKGIGRLGDGASRVTGRWDDAEKQK
jgi:hypothetical protein